MWLCSRATQQRVWALIGLRIRVLPQGEALQVQLSSPLPQHPFSLSPPRPPPFSLSKISDRTLSQGWGFPMHTYQPLSQHGHRGTGTGLGQGTGQMGPATGVPIFLEFPRQWGRQQQPQTENAQLKQVSSQVRSRGQGERWGRKAPRLDDTLCVWIHRPPGSGAGHCNSGFYAASAAGMLCDPAESLAVSEPRCPHMYN